MKKDRDLQRFLKIRDLISSLNEIEELIIVVEGTSDRDGLKTIGINKEIIVYNERSFWSKILRETATSKKILILTDFDREGEEINDRIEKRIETYGYVILREWRRRFRSDTVGLGQEIYEIARSIYRLQREFTGI
jgi:5S rRNA maturation endonuclease (ribonuclease M5)